MMRRRPGLVLALVLSPTLLLSTLIATEAQQATKVRRIGYLSLFSEDSPQAALREAFAAELRALGHVEGQKATIEYRFAEGLPDKLTALAGQLVRSAPDVLVGEGIQAALALKAATTSIPTVTLSCDAVAAGLVPDLARPGGNITGVTCNTAEMAAKRLELLKAFKPGMRRVGILWNAADTAKANELSTTQAAAAVLDLQSQSFEVREAEDFDKAFAAMRDARIDALFTLADAFMIFHRSTIARHALALRLPAMYSFREFVDVGGLISYGPDALEMFRRMAPYVDKVLRGARPGELPIEQPTKFELVINLKTARALGLRIPHSLLLRADEVID